ncbi:hypothetical protein M426DRAFT_324145 [Hypoxylon sp. CI-4A]|nr:hypothetical protein M426DRAFT_324145 [Hypoxylon sp. CI-4A]
MQLSNPPMASASRDPYTPAYIDNAKSLSSNMIFSPERTLGRAPERSGRPLPLAEDREPLLGHHTTHSPDIHVEYISDDYPHERTCRLGLPIIVLCRTFNTIFTACTVDRMNKYLGYGWDLRINKLVLDFCWIALAWNAFALTYSIVGCMFFQPGRRERRTHEKSFRDKMRIHFACNDAILGIIILVLLTIASRFVDPHFKGAWAGLVPSIVAMVSVLVAAELLTATIQPLPFSEKMLFTIC